MRRAPGDKRPTPFPPARTPVDKKKKVPTKAIVIRSPVPSSSSASSSELGLPERIPGQYGSGPSMPVFERLALPAEEEASVDQPDSPHPDADGMGLVVAVNEPVGEVVGASCPNPKPLSATPMEEARVERQDLPPYEPSALALVPVKGPTTGRSRLPRDLTTGISGRLQDRLYETIEVNCSSAREDHPKGYQMEIAGEDPSDLVFIPDEDSLGDVPPTVNEEGPTPGEEPHNDDPTKGDPSDDVACVSVSPFSYAELGEMLNHIFSGSDVDLPSVKMFETAEMV